MAVRLSYRAKAETSEEVAPEGTTEADCRTWYQAYGEPLYSFHLSSPDQAEDLTGEVVK